MDLNSLLSSMFSPTALANMSKAAGVSQEETKNVLGFGLPSMLTGALNQSQGVDTASSFTNALWQHAKNMNAAANPAAFWGNLDMFDGSKIVNHLFGGNADMLGSISRQAGVSQKNTASILSAAAPYLMSLLGQQTQQTVQANQGASMLSSLFGGQQQNQQAAQGANVLSALFGGQQVQQSTQPAAQPVQPIQQTQQAAQSSAVNPWQSLNTASMMSSLLGNADLSSMMSSFLGGGAQQTQQNQQNNAANNMLGMFGSLFGGK